MKRYLILGAIAIGLFVLLLCWHGPQAIAPAKPEATAEVGAVSTSKIQEASGPEEESGGQARAKAEDQTEISDKERLLLEGPELARTFNATHNIPVAFYGKILDQDDHPLNGATITMGVQESYQRSDYPFRYTRKWTEVEKVTAADGRFEVTGLKGDGFDVRSIIKDGYEQEPAQRGYGPQSGSFAEPIVFRMWRTNIPHEQLITGDKSSVIIPDGRRYGIDLTNGVTGEGIEGDLMVWLKRPAVVGWEKYSWSCELTAQGRGGFLEETKDTTMFIAPGTGYTNVFAFEQEATLDGWTHGLYGKRFYIRLRNGQIYGRMTVNLSSGSSRQGPAVIRLQYAINPSGSRLLR